MNETTRSFRILIVEDFAENADALSVYLHAKGHTTKVIGDGVEALAAIPIFSPDIILLDLGLPGMNGIKICQSIREKREYDDVLIVACTCWDSDQSYRAAIEAGFDLFLGKPIALDDLAIMLEKHSRGSYGGSAAVAD